MPVMYEIGDEESPSLSDQEELMHAEESEASSDVEDAPPTCSAKDSPDSQPGTETTHIESSGASDIFITSIILILSSSGLMILFPLYVEQLSPASGPLVVLIFPSSCCVLTLLVLTTVLGKIGCLGNTSITRCPLPFKRLCKSALSYGTGVLLVAHAQLSGRVPCHLQDPLKAAVILFSLLYYFFFCKKMLGLRKLFAASVMAVGLFIAADYGLCDKFKCRGAQSRIEGNWEARAGWTIVYLIGLGLFTLHFTITEENIIQRPPGALYLSLSGSLLATVSRMVALDESCDRIYARDDSSEIPSQRNNDQCCLTGNPERSGKKSSLLITLWIQVGTWILVMASGIFYIAASAGDMNPEKPLWNTTIEGIACHMPNWSPPGSVQHLISSQPVVSFGVTDDHIQGLIDDHNDALKELQSIEEIYTKSQMNKRHLLDHKTYFNKENRFRDSNLYTNTGHKKHFSPEWHTSKENIGQEKLNHLKHKSIKTIKSRKNITIEKKNSLSKFTNHNKNISKPAIQRTEALNNNIQNELQQPKTTIENVHPISENQNSTFFIALHKVQNITHSRKKRMIIHTDPIGFKIIHPTESILYGHVITNKIKPNLIGHVILNKTTISINGFEIFPKNEITPVKHEQLNEKIQQRHNLIPASKDVEKNSKSHVAKQALGKKNTEKIRNNRHHHRKSHKQNEMNFKRIKREDITETTNGSSDIDYFFKNIRMSEKKQLNPVDNENIDISEDRNRDVVRYEVSDDNIVRITDKRQSEQSKFMNRVDGNVVYRITKMDSGGCNYISFYGWAAFVAYTSFSISSIRFLVICQSSVFTIAMMTLALPFTGVWWAVVSQNPDGSLEMRPGMSGELICALLGLPIVLLGLTLLFKAHLNQSLNILQAELTPQVVFSGLSTRMSREKLCGEQSIEYELGSSPQAHLT